MKKEKVAIVSGYFNPIHPGHIEYFKMSKKLAKYLAVIVNNDKQTLKKSGKIFMTCKDRIEIVNAIKYVNLAIESIDTDPSVCETIKLIVKRFGNTYDYIFCNGGDRKQDNIPEYSLCETMGIEMVFNLGEKIQSSSNLLKNYESR